MSRYIPGRGFEPDPRVGRRGEIVNRPTRDLNNDGVWSGGSRDFDERSGSYRPGFRDEGRRGGRRGGGGRRGWWNEPRRGNIPPRVDSRPPRNDTDRWEKLTGGNRLSSDSERMDLLTGKRSLPGDSERMRLLTGEADSGREYDPQDRKFNRQFNTETRGEQPWDSDSRSNPLERDPLEGYNNTSGRYNEPQPKTGIKQAWNKVRDTITPSAYEYGGNIAKSAFQGGEQVNRTDFKKSDIVSLFERTDASRVPRTIGEETPFSDANFYEKDGNLTEHSILDKTYKNYEPNARNLVNDFEGSSNPFVDGAKKVAYGYQNPLGVRGQGFVEINQPNQFESPTAIYKDAAYLNLQSNDPNETNKGQNWLGRAIGNITGNKSNIIGKEFATARLPYEKWSPKMRQDYGFPSFGDSLEKAEKGGKKFSDYVAEYESSSGLGQTNQPESDYSEPWASRPPKYRLPDGSWTDIPQANQISGGPQDTADLTQKALEKEAGVTNRPATVDLNKPKELPSQQKTAKDWTQVSTYRPSAQLQSLWRANEAATQRINKEWNKGNPATGFNLQPGIDAGTKASKAFSDLQEKEMTAHQKLTEEQGGNYWAAPGESYSTWGGWPANWLDKEYKGKYWY